MIQALRKLRNTRPVDGESMGLAARYTQLIADIEQKLRDAARGVLELQDSISAATTWIVNRCGELDQAQPCLVHGDFRIGNAIFRDARLAAVLDWERAMVGHPMHDAGYLCLPGMRIGDRISGLWSAQEFARMWGQEMESQFDARLCALCRVISIYIEFCNMLRAMARLAAGVGRLEGMRAIPLIMRLHVDLLAAMRSWDSGQFAL
jgi:aminoglycoside phosphotransferase (APT) family kinase protein